MTVTRFAPSPTGLLHAGNLRTAVLNWLVARKQGGRFILRIDDTDPERSEERFVDAIRRDLEWLGLTWDAEHRQSERLDLYHDAAGRLRDAGRLYDCYETAAELDLRRKVQLSRHLPPVYDRAALKLSDADRARLQAEGRAAHWRFLLQHAPIEWNDLIRGDERVDPASLSDPVLIREDGQILYTLASVVDDAEMGVTHVIRGADHVTNTGTQIQIFSALGAEPPAFGHHSLLTGPGGEALSKRLGSLSVAALREAGVEPVALVSFLARLGSSAPVEVVSDMQAVIDGFDISSFGASPTRFDPDELTAHSSKTLRGMPFEYVRDRLEGIGIPKEISADIWSTIGPNLDRLEDAGEWWSICRDGAQPVVAPEDEGFVADALAILPPRPWDEGTWKVWTDAVKAKTGRKGRGLFLPLRRVLTGRDRGPEMAALMPLLAPPRLTGGPAGGTEDA
ncbi:glutamate--tRNA ligase [Limibaculum sp. M0105]|uniref:Glutamate--tRNA ligase n=1 Tax=Thermohalobaculum xanthum TaxID=2753746 RepID=A0A8J7SCK1_9RHOB|nr:glutamate--tRNA ligase [Thermohalobaculum xanthum]MBK0397947.1 glutamate--tRNA ligase [Thermohalobaculum xanthum]